MPLTENGKILRCAQNDRRSSMKVRGLVASFVFLLAGCGGAAPAASSPSAPSQAASKPAAAPASAAPAGSVKPEAAGSGSPAAKPAAGASGLVGLKGTYTTVSPTGGPSWAAK